MKNITLRSVSALAFLTLTLASCGQPATPAPQNTLDTPVESAKTLHPADISRALIPKVLNTSPAPGAMNVMPQGMKMTIDFSQPMNPNVAQSLTFSPAVDNLNCTMINPRITGAPNRLTCTGYFGWNADYTVTVGADATSTSGGKMGVPYTFSFKTATLDYTPDVTAPTAVSFNPTPGNGNGAIWTHLAVMNVTFNEPMNKATTEAAFQLSVPGLDNSKKVFTWNPQGTQVSLTYNVWLETGTQVTWGMSNAATDLSGNHLANAASIGSTFKL
ncbi:Ig-like domain-containing protein [Deinococcus oregonensis]|uniref:Ig-like domain-containing protein n=1 Tax=Deinococcus oregonensis TaxID=1805970 RepID=A0ABV6B1W2_9DEIO